MYVSSLCLKVAVSTERVLDICYRAYLGSIMQKLKPHIATNIFMLSQPSSNTTFRRIVSSIGEWYTESTKSKRIILTFFKRDHCQVSFRSYKYDSILYSMLTMYHSPIILLMIAKKHKTFSCNMYLISVLYYLHI